LTGAREIRKKLQRDVLILPPVSEAIRDLTAFGERAAKAGAPRDLGGLQNDIVSEVTPLMGRIHFVGASAGVKALAIERGRSAGKKQPPASALAGWASRHGHGSDARTLFVIARAIGRRGKKGRFFMRKARLLIRREMKGNVIEKMAAQVEAIWRR
jgi:hypothetical protein